MKLLIVTLVGFAVSVPIQNKAIHEMETEVCVGTPDRKYMLTVDFMSAGLRFFGAKIRSPFFGSVHHSSSVLAGTRGKGIVDNVTLAGMHFRDFDIDSVLVPDFETRMHIADSEGILGLSPQSPLL